MEETHAHHTGNMSPGLECTAKAVLGLAVWLEADGHFSLEMEMQTEGI